MSFRGRLRLFFVLLVIVPMIALAVVLFTLTSRSETGRADAGISAGARTAFGIYDEAASAAEPALHDVASDRRLRAALSAGAGLDLALERLLGGPQGIVLIELYSQEEQLIARAGSAEGLPRAELRSPPAARRLARSRSRPQPPTSSPAACETSPGWTPPCTGTGGCSPPPRTDSRSAADSGQ